jgi:hypothetical protein
MRKLRDGFQPVNFTTGERGMQEKANLDGGHAFLDERGLVDPVVGDTLHGAIHLTTCVAVSAWEHPAEEHGKEHKVVVLDPDHVARTCLLADSFGEIEICLAIREPILFVKVHLARVVMEEGPEDGVGEAVVVPVSEVVIEVDGLTGILLHETTVDKRTVLERDIETRPADPGKIHRLLAAREGGDEATRGHFEVVLARRILADGDGKAIADDNESF